MKKRRTEKSVKRSKTIFLIIIVAALISITGTYAWFSSQRDVEIVGFKINVEIAENLEISLDGETWVHSINIENMRQFYGTYKDKDETTVVYQAVKDQHRNYVPTELLPVSTVGSVAEVNNESTGNLIFVTGEIKDYKLEKVEKCSEEDIKVGSTILDKEANNAKHPYLVFDMYLRNLSRLKGEGERDLLQLNTGSQATAAKKGTGLENSVRVGLVQYGNTEEFLANGEEARAIKPNGQEKVAIWEPNYRLHTEYTARNDKRITDLVQEIDTFAIRDKRPIEVEENGQTKIVYVDTTEIEDTTDNTDEALENVLTNKVMQNEKIHIEDEDGTVTQEEKLDTIEVTTLKDIDGADMSLVPNTITKVRCYIWLEGQDPDCTNLASTGDELIVTLRLTKPKTEGTGTDNSYDGEE